MSTPQNNLLITSALDANVHNLAESIATTPQGQPVAVLPRDLPVVRVAPNEFHEENLNIELPTTDPNLIPFAHPEWMASAEEVREFALSGYRGVLRDSSGQFRGVKGEFIEPYVLSRIHFLLLPIAQQGEELPNPTPLFASRDGSRMLVPFVGDIFVAGRKLSDEELAKLGLEWLKDSEGHRLEYLALPMGNRSVFIPSKLGIGKALDSESAPLGWQWKGVGVRRYVYHTVMLDQETGTANLADKADIIIAGADVSQIPHGVPVQRPVYAGVSGVLVDLRHQPAADVPVGGEANPSEALRTQRELAKAGAETARVMTEVGTLLSKSSLDGLLGTDSTMTLPELFVTCETWSQFGGTSLRYDAVTRPFRVMLNGFASARTSAAKNLAELLEVEVGSSSKEAREEKLRQMSTKLGQAVLAALKAGRTHYVDRNTDDNLTWFGFPLDYGDYHKASGWHQNASLVLRYTYDLLRFARAAGVSLADFFSEGFARHFLEVFLDENDIEPCINLGSLLLSRTEPSDQSQEAVLALLTFACEVMGRWTSSHMLVEGEEERSEAYWEINPQNLIHFCATNRAIAEEMASLNLSFNRGTLESAKRTLKRGNSVLVTGPGLPSNGEKLSAVQVANLLLPSYLKHTLRLRILLKDKPEDWSKGPPVHTKRR